VICRCSGHDGLITPQNPCPAHGPFAAATPDPRPVLGFVNSDPNRPRDQEPVSPPSELTAEPFTEQQVQRWREEVAKKPRGFADWPDDEVLKLVDRFLATLDAARAAPQADANLEGYWERAYWEIVPKLQAALDAARQADAGALDVERLRRQCSTTNTNWTTNTAAAVTETKAAGIAATEPTR
jgi:hypothetical protein